MVVQSTPVSIAVLLDKNAPYASPLSWTISSTSTHLVIGGTNDSSAAQNDFDEVSFFLYE